MSGEGVEGGVGGGGEGENEWGARGVGVREKGRRVGEQAMFWRPDRRGQREQAISGYPPSPFTLSAARLSRKFAAAMFLKKCKGKSAGGGKSLEIRHSLKATRI